MTEESNRAIVRGIDEAIRNTEAEVLRKGIEEFIVVAKTCEGSYILRDSAVFRLEAILESAGRARAQAERGAK